MATVYNREGLLSHQRMYPHGSDQHYVKEYIDMMTSPGTSKAVRAPAISPYIASNTHVRRVLDVNGPATNGGSYGVFVKPNNIFPYATSGALTVFPAVSGPLSLHNDPAIPVNEIGGGCKMYVNSAGSTTSYLSSNVNYAGTTYSAWPISMPAGTYAAQMTIPQSEYSSAVGTQYYFRIYAGVAGIWTALCSVQSVSVAGVFPAFACTVPVGGSFSLAVVRTDSVGTPANPQSNIAGAVFLFYPDGQMQPTGSMVAFSDDHAKIVNLEDSQTLSHRIVAMSMLVSNLSSDLNNQGRIVIGRADPRVMSNYTTLAEAQAALSRLPDASRVYDGPLRDGGYTWYMPDDIASYEPAVKYHSTDPNNLLACVISGMDTTDGSIRIIIDYIVEFYTPNQLLSRSPSPVWDDRLLGVFSELLCSPAASANFAHAALVSSIAAGALKAAQFYAANKSWIDPAVAGAYRTVLKQVSSGEEKAKSAISKVGTQGKNIVAGKRKK